MENKMKKTDNSAAFLEYGVNFQELSYIYGETKRLMSKNIKRLVKNKEISKETENKIYEGVGKLLPWLNINPMYIKEQK